MPPSVISGGRRLHDFDAREEFHRQVAEIHVTSAANGQRQRGDAVELDANQAGSAPRMLTPRPSPSWRLICTPGTRWMRFAHVLVGKVTHVFGGDGVDHLDGVALDAQRVAHAGANAVTRRPPPSPRSGVRVLCLGRLSAWRWRGLPARRDAKNDSENLRLNVSTITPHVVGTQRQQARRPCRNRARICSLMIDLQLSASIARQCAHPRPIWGMVAITCSHKRSDRQRGRDEEDPCHGRRWRWRC